MDVFVYGTLRDPNCAVQAVPGAKFGGRATLYGLHAVEGRYPNAWRGASAKRASSSNQNSGR
jgi:gamma-glutamylcyclotransferase (GGCT)/AIG2-like uncharacterized protein YtfP